MNKYPAIDELPAGSALPNRFETFDSGAVSTPAGWRDVRRAELRQMFQHLVYGSLNLDGPNGTAWGTPAAWGWGLSRGVEYLRFEDAVTDSGIGVMGHSCRGKAALFAAARDDRKALAVPHQSGTGGWRFPGPTGRRQSLT